MCYITGMGNRVVWDQGNWPKCGKHGVSKAEIEHVLIDPTARITPDPFPDEERFRAIARNADGRYVFVVFTPAEDDRRRPISARYMHRKEFDRYV